MCLILIAQQLHADFPLVIAANRDEYFARPAQPAGFWPEAPDLLAGKDLTAGGTWLGITRQGRFAALTNVREPGYSAEDHTQPDRSKPEDTVSRGHLVTGFLTSKLSPKAYLKQIKGERYNGFNLICGDLGNLFFGSNRQPDVMALPDGPHGLSNSTINTPWPKVVEGKNSLQVLLSQPSISPDSLLPVLNHRQRASDEWLPKTGVGLNMERILSSRFIEGQSFDYGTRVSTVILMHRNGNVQFKEWQWDEQGEAVGATAFEFELLDQA